MATAAASDALCFRSFACASASTRARVLLGSASMVLVLVTCAAVATHASTLSSSSYSHTGGVASASAAGSGALVSSVPASEPLSLDATVGAAPTARPSGSSTTLASVLPGLWPLVRGVFPTLDLDGDLAHFFLDDDDDGDGLLDVHETATGSFVSATNTGSSPVDADSDDDGFADGVEVAAGSDPNDAGSTPAPGVPSTGWPVGVLLAVSLVTLALARLRLDSLRRMST